MSLLKNGTDPCFLESVYVFLAKLGITVDPDPILDVGPGGFDSDIDCGVFPNFEILKGDFPHESIVYTWFNQRLVIIILRFISL